MKTQTIIPQSKRSLLGKRIAVEEAYGWKVFSTGIGLPTLGGRSALQKTIEKAEREGFTADFILGAKVGNSYSWAVIVRREEQPHPQQCSADPQVGDMLFLYTDKSGRKVPIFAPDVESADSKAEDAGLSDLSDFRAYALADVTGLLQ